MEFDAMFRFLQDAGNADTDDAGLPQLGLAWVARRSVIEVLEYPTAREPLTLTTWCSGTSARWAERRTSIRGAHGGRVEAAALWIHIDAATGRPAKWGDDFAAAYLEAAQGREGCVLVLCQQPVEDSTERQKACQAAAAEHRQGNDQIDGPFKVQKRLQPIDDVKVALQNKQNEGQRSEASRKPPQGG